MDSTREVDPKFYETHCFAEDLAEAEAAGDLIISNPGENIIEAIKRHMHEKEKLVAVTSNAV
ncbi:MAG: hypothetical protein FWC23_01395 [Chitinispirillia bacterium]|nr:hypothetical protein [Chitinispirillia bacterium]MCL2267831.1 hypothetical protein [Chitinispirillia bacterium]